MALIGKAGNYILLSISSDRTSYRLLKQSDALLKHCISFEFINKLPLIRPTSASYLPSRFELLCSLR